MPRLIGAPAAARLVVAFCAGWGSGSGSGPGPGPGRRAGSRRRGFGFGFRFIVGRGSRDMRGARTNSGEGRCGSG
ncbi:putative oxygen-independent coproporphyrinogen III oxidase [Burkholderia pseudomallei 406e]|nr:putative oxygen-independent coproporphyrinogen III oxidase [Burkholderia pseudomallei 406e]